MKGTYITRISKVFNKLLLILLSIIFTLNIIITSSIIISDSRMKLKNTASEYTSQVDSYLLELKTRLNSVVAAFQSNTITEYNNRVTFLDSIAKENSFISATYLVTSKDKKVIMNNGWTPPDDFDVTTREWYNNAISSDDIYVSDPYVDEQTENLCVTISKRVMLDGELLGVVGIDMYLDKIVQIISESYNGNNYSFLTTASGTILVHPKEDLMLSADNTQTLESALNGKYQSLIGTNMTPKIILDYKGGFKSIILSPSKESSWQIVSVQSISSICISIIFIILINIFLYILSLFISKKYINKEMLKWFAPINSISNKVNRIADGDLTVTFDEEQITDEIELLTTSLNTTVKRLKYYIDDINSVIESISNNDISISINSEYHGEFVKIKESLEKILNELNSSFKIIKQHSKDVSNCSFTVKSSTEKASENADNESDAINSVANNVSILADKLKIINDTAENASEISKITNEKLQVQNDEMKNLLNAMDTINENSDKINEIVTTINDLAEQTNLLSLNASIEAARAGEAGKGFSIVAEEISKLADESSNASKKIANLILNSNIAVEKGRELTITTAESLKEGINNSLKSQNGLLEITELVKEENKFIMEIKAEIDNISKISLDNANYSKNNIAISNALINKSNDLNKTINEFKLKDKE
ncbi:MAG: methyl-accepting chemotaxis protein [Clostridiales bacterium]|nr:methyl-accepting chemotaxis protein [Clostridiales bacterium]